MSHQSNALNAYAQYISWVQSLRQVPQSLWLAPLEPGKWSIGEIIAHLMAWDRFVEQERLPALQSGALLAPSPDETTFNERAAAYARAGITRDQLIEDFINVRRGLVQQLQNLPEGQFQILFALDGHSMTLDTYLNELVDHDREHQEEIEAFLKENGLPR